MFDKDDEGVLKAAEDYATAVQKLKLGDITDLMTNGEDLEETLDYLVNDTEGMPDGYADSCSAIAGTISSTINFVLEDEAWLVDDEYTCIFYTLDGEEIAQSTCEVELS